MGGYTFWNTKIALLGGALVAMIALAERAGSATLTCTWNSDDDGFWTDTIDQFGPEITSEWDCLGVTNFAKINFPHFIPSPGGGITFTAQIGDGATVTVLPLLPIVISNLELSDESTVRLVDGSNFFIQNTGGGDGQVSGDGSIELVNLLGALSTNMTVDGQVTFSGGGKVLLGGPGNAVSGNNGVNLSATMILDDYMVEGSGALGGESMSLRVNSLGKVRSNVPLETLEIDPGADNNIVNRGVLEALDGGTLRLKQTAVINHLGTITAGPASLVELQEVTLSDGELEGSGVIRGTSSVTFEGSVSSRSNYVVGNGTTTLLDGTFVNHTQIVIDGGSFLTKTPSVLAGTGTVTLGVPAAPASTLGAVFDSGATLSNQGNTINGGGNINVPITNGGSIVADEPGFPLRIIAPVTNLTTMEATGGAELNVRRAVDNSGGSVSATDGTVRVSNGGSITGGTVAVSSGSRLEVADGAVDATVSNDFGGVIAATQFRTNTLAGTIENESGGEIVIEDSAALVFTGASSYLNAGTVRLNGDGVFASFSNSALLLDGTVRLEGFGKVAMSNSSKNIILSQGGTLSTFINEDHLIEGSGQIGRNSTNLENHAFIHANQPPTAEAGTGLITIDPGAAPMINTATMQASNLATLQLRDGTYTNVGGIISALSGSTVALESAATISGGTLFTSGSGKVEVRRDATFDGASSALSVDARTFVTSLGQLRLTGDVANSKSMAVAPGGQIRIDGPVTLTGGGVIDLTGPTSRLTTLPGSIPGDLLINVDNTIKGAGSVLFLEIQNGGILAPGDSPGRLVTGALTMTESSVLEIEIQGDANGEFDVLQVQAPVSLDGTLRIVALPGLEVSAGATFDFLLSGGINGAFSQIEIPGDGGGQPLFSLSQVGNNLRLTALSDIDLPSAYEAWTIAEGLTALNSGATEDPNGDGLDNQTAYFLGVPALGITPGNGIEIGPGPAGGAVLHFSSPLSATGVTVGTELSHDLGAASWSPGPVPVVIGTTATHTLYEVVVPLDGPRVFGRLATELQAAP